jgi:hypothetical protein
MYNCRASSVRFRVCSHMTTQPNVDNGVSLLMHNILISVELLLSRSQSSIFLVHLELGRQWKVITFHMFCVDRKVWNFALFFMSKMHGNHVN